MTTLSTQARLYVELPAILPSGYACVPIATSEEGASVQLCVVVRQAPIVLRESLDAKVYLGCLADRAGRVHRWLELWVQDPDGLGNSPVAYREHLTNKVLDERWIARVEAFDRAGGIQGLGHAGLVRTGFEVQHPAPMFVDIEERKAVAPVDGRSGRAWALCKDEAMLAKQGVSGYASALNRNLYQPELGLDAIPFPVEMASADPTSVGLPAGTTAFNPGGGLMMALSYCPLGYEQFTDALTGSPVEAAAGGDGLVRLLAVAAGLGASPSASKGGWLGLSSVDASGRLVESLHLKLAALAQAVGTVRAYTSATQAPMLNITANSFRVRMGEGSGALPLWWTARTALVEPGEAVELPLEGTSERYFMSGRAGNVSAYSPSAQLRTVSGKGWLRLRNVLLAGGTGGADNGTILEGTLSTQDRIESGRNDLLWMRFSLGGVRLDSYAVVDAQSAMGRGELRVRTVAQEFAPAVVERLKAALGAPIQDVSFEVVPLLSTPCDMYALGVLGVRTLLVEGGRTLPVALDELLSLGRELSQTEAGELLMKMESLFNEDPRWAESLGPQRLLHDVKDSGFAFEAIPKRLWMCVLLSLMKMFTGLFPFSRCKDLGDAPSGGAHRIFDPVLEELHGLMVACRTLIVADFALNREVRGVLDGCLAQVRR